MYKLLLVSDQEDVLNAFSRIQNWELIGFKPPHIRHDYEGMLDSLSKHHADGICLAVSHEQEELMLAYLQENFPKVSIFEAGRTEEEVLRYLNELKALLNAFFHPLGEGVSANEVKAFLENEHGVSFETYLHQKYLIAARADVEALAEKYASDSANRRRVTLEKDSKNELFA